MPLVGLRTLAVGGELTVIVKVCSADVSIPPPSRPPSSWSRTARVAVPKAAGAAVKLRMPSALRAGGAEKRLGLLMLVNWKVNAWPASSGGPAVMALAQFVTVNQRLPANLGTVADPIGIGAFGAAVASALLARDADEQPARVELVTRRQTPAIADTIANHVRAGIAGWPVHDPQIDPARILLHTAPVLDAATGAGPG